MHFPHAPPYIYVFSYFFFMRATSASCSVSTIYKFFLSDILLSAWLIFNTMFLNWKLITLVLLSWVVILLAVPFDNIWNSMEYVVIYVMEYLDDTWRYLSKTIDIWVERYLVIFNDNLAILTTETFTLEPENYRSKDIVNLVIYHLVGTEL